MKKIIVIIVIFCTGCSQLSSVIKTGEIRERDITIHCMIEEHKTLHLIFTNNTEDAIFIHNPCSANTFLYVLRNGIEVQRKLMSRINPECAATKHLIQAGKKRAFTPYGHFPFSDLYTMERGGEYEIYAVYYPTAASLKNEKGIKSKLYYYKALGNGL